MATQIRGDVDIMAGTITNAQIAAAAAIAYTKLALTGAIVNADIVALAWSKLTGTPTSLAGYGITDPIVLTSGSYANPAWITSLAGAKITGTVALATAASTATLAAAATVLATPRTINGVSFDGSGNITIGAAAADITGTLGVIHGGTGTATAFTAGSIVFAGASGVYAQDNANFFYDATNKRFGIGTASPGRPLDVRAASGSSQLLTLANSDFVFASAGSSLQVSSGATSGDTYIAIQAWKAGENTVGVIAFQGTGGSTGMGGVTAPTARLHLAAGSATANTAPLKLNSGTLLTTAEAGAVEFLTDKFFGTITTGAARKTFAFLEAPTFTSSLNLTGGPLTVKGAGTTTGIGIQTQDSGGNVNVTITDVGLLNITRGSAASITTKGLQIRFDHTANTGHISASQSGTANYPLHLGSDGFTGSGIYIDAVGNVGIGTTSPVTNGTFTIRRAVTGIVTGYGVAASFSDGAHATLQAVISTSTTACGFFSVQDLVFGGGSTENFRMLATGGQIGIGTSSPTARLHIKAGSATASTAPLKFTSGTVLTTAEAGAVEFLTDDYFATITTGAARKAFVLDDGARLTSGKIPIAGTNGRLVDGQTPLAGTKVYYVSDTSGGAVTRKLTFTNGILTAET